MSQSQPTPTKVRNARGRSVTWLLPTLGVWVLFVQGFTVWQLVGRIDSLDSGQSSHALTDDPSAWVERLQRDAQAWSPADMALWPAVVGVAIVFASLMMRLRRPRLRTTLTLFGIVLLLGGLVGAWFSVPSAMRLNRAYQSDCLLSHYGISAFSASQGGSWADDIRKGRPDWVDAQAELHRYRERAATRVELIRFKVRRYARFLLWPTSTGRLPGD